MSQEDWVKKKRKERNDEFAPPRMYEENKTSSSKSQSPSKSPERESPEVEIGPLPPLQKPKSLFFTSKTQRAHSSKAGSSLVSLPDNVYIDVSRPPPSVNKAFMFSKESGCSERSTGKEPVQPKYKKIVNEVTNPIEISSDEETVEPPRGKGTEIAPPPTYEYYGHSAVRGKGQKKSQKMDEIEKSISVGLKFLRKQQEEKAKKKDKGLLDII